MPNPQPAAADSQPRRQRARRLLLAAIALLVLTTAVGLALHVWHGFLDLHVYRMGARVFLDGDQLYGHRLPQVDGTNLPFTYPPLAAIAFAPLAVIPVGLGDVVMFALTLAALAATLWLVLARLRPEGDRTLRLALVIALTAAFEFIEPVRENLGFGQVNMLLMILIAFDVLNRHRRWPRGLLIGIAVSIKLTPAGFLLYFALRRDWRAVGTMVAGTVAAVAVAWAVAPADSSKYWFETLGETGRIGAPYFAGNQSIKGAVFRFGWSESTSTVIWVALSVLAVAVAACWMYRLLAADQEATALLVNAAVVLLISPVSWSHHWVWVAPALLTAGYAVYTRRFSAWFTAATAFALVLFSVGPHWLMPARHDLELTWSWWQHIVGDAYVWFTFAALIVGAVWWRRESALEPELHRPVTTPDTTTRSAS